MFEKYVYLINIFITFFIAPLGSWRPTQYPPMGWLGLRRPCGGVARMRIPAETNRPMAQRRGAQTHLR